MENDAMERVQAQAADVQLAAVSVTWRGETGDLADPMRYDASEAEVLAAATEAIRSGAVRGVRADRMADLADFRVERLPADVASGRQMPTLLIRPKTAYGDAQET